MSDSKVISSILVGVILGICLCFGGCYGCSKIQSSDGYRDSTIRKLSYSGVIWKTWEVEALGDGIRMGSQAGDGKNVGAETFTYSIEDPEVLKKVQDLPPGRRVRIYYHKYFAVWTPRGERSYFITGIDTLD